MRFLRALSLAVVWAAIFTGCSSSTNKNNAAKSKDGAEEKASPPAQEATVFAAASTQEAVEAVVAEFERLNPDVKIRVSFASSATLAEQIGSGAPADLFLSASGQWVDSLNEKKLVAEKYDLLGNQLVAIVPADATWQVDEPADLANEEIQHIAIGDPDSVPAGIYAKEALTKLELWEPLEERFVAGEDVRHALAMVEEGAVEAGIVYTTDAAVSDKVRVGFLFETDLTSPIVYPLVLTRRGVKSSAARELYHFLQSKSAAKIFSQAGFRVQQKVAVQ